MTTTRLTKSKLSLVHRLKYNQFIMGGLISFLSLEKPVGVTNSPHSPLSASYITLSAYDKSLPLKLNYLHNQIVP
jgi:hypothetical protein